MFTYQNQCVMKPLNPSKLYSFKKLIRSIRNLAIALTILLFMLSFSPSWSQGYQKGNKRFYKSYYKKQIVLYANACNILERKHNKLPRRPLFASHHKLRTSMTEVTSSPVVQNTEARVRPDPKPLPKPVVQPLPTVTPKIEHISVERLAELHKREDEVLVTNNIPLPTSKKHESVRKLVGDKLASKTNVYPLILAPLFFNFNEDEFSVVDMEPFLVAAEYAIQGRTVLIEGHTDSRGADDFNVKLSIKRVQKIRQLMLDMGVPDERISVVGYGEEIKTNSNSTTQGRQQNRRVDFTIF